MTFSTGLKTNQGIPSGSIKLTSSTDGSKVIVKNTMILGTDNTSRNIQDQMNCRNMFFADTKMDANTTLKLQLGIL